MQEKDYKYIYRINSPADLKTLKPEELKDYCDELRHFVIMELAANPGHLGSSLGVVELTVALHYVFNTPADKLIWDVGHQAYIHKIITGRRDIFHTNRKFRGLSGFPKRSESEYDPFGGGHTSVSISAALGMAKAAQLRGEKSDVVAIIGDGALTGGLAFEGLNNAGAEKNDMLVILNDNDMSIDPNVGALKEYLLNMTTSERYNMMKNRTWNMLSRMPRVRRMLQKANRAVKHGLLQQSNLFESLNFRYFGPVDGHDVEHLARTLENLKNIPGPKLLHVLTVKGKGYKPAEDNQPLWHAPGKFDPETGEREFVESTPNSLRYQDVFGRTLLELARTNGRIVGITPAMPSGCSMTVMMDEMPERCFDVGIAEGHAVTFSAGLAAAGMIPFCNIYSSFMQRAYDNVIHDVALQNLGVVFCLDRAGIVGEDGPTHHGAFDMAYFRCIPNMVVSAPMNEAELRNLMYTAHKSGVPFAIRYPRGRGPGELSSGDFITLPIGKGRILREGRDVAVLSIGHIGNAAAKAVELAARQGVDALHADLRYVKPLDSELLHRIGREFTRVITVEDGTVVGGAGSAVAEFMAANGYTPRIDMVGLPDLFVEHGSIRELHAEYGLDAEGILRHIVEK